MGSEMIDRQGIEALAEPEHVRIIGAKAEMCSRPACIPLPVARGAVPVGAGR
jgi:hypothetical protein